MSVYMNVVREAEQPKMAAAPVSANGVTAVATAAIVKRSRPGRMRDVMPDSPPPKDVAAEPAGVVPASPEVATTPPSSPTHDKSQETFQDEVARLVASANSGGQASTPVELVAGPTEPEVVASPARPETPDPKQEPFVFGGLRSTEELSELAGMPEKTPVTSSKFYLLAGAGMVLGIAGMVVAEILGRHFNIAFLDTTKFLMSTVIGVSAIAGLIFFWKHDGYKEHKLAKTFFTLGMMILAYGAFYGLNGQNFGQGPLTKSIVDAFSHHGWQDWTIAGGIALGSVTLLSSLVAAAVIYRKREQAEESNSVATNKWFVGKYGPSIPQTK